LRDKHRPGGNTAGAGGDQEQKAEARVWVPSLVLLTALAAVVVGLIMVICTGGSAGPGHSGTGIGLLVFGTPVLAVAGAILAYRPRERRRASTVAFGTLALLVMFASLTAFLAAIAGQVVRWVDPADYFGRYGSKATVTLPDKCQQGVRVYAGSGAKAADADVVCHGSTWRVDGVSHSGTVVIAFEDTDLPTGVAVPDRVEAYVLGDKGYSLHRVGKAEDVGAWGVVPLWWLPVGLVVALSSIVALRKVGWVAPRRQASAGVPVEPGQL
jgi:hypothetical protein